MFGNNISWQQSMLRITNPKASLDFYCNVLGMTLIAQMDLPQFKFSLYFLQTLPKNKNYIIDPKSDQAIASLWNMKGVTLELTFNHDSDEVYHPGNEKNDGFGHIAFSCIDVYKSSSDLESKGVKFKKRPDEGRMKGLAFIYDPDGYWVELVRRETPPGSESTCKEFSLAQTMLRVKDPKKSIAFYEKLGMTLLKANHLNGFSLYFMATVHDKGLIVPEPESHKADAFIRSNLYAQNIPVLELTHNHSTESDSEFKHFSGNEEGKRGFGHLGFLVDDVYDVCAKMQEEKVEFKKLPDEGMMKGLAFAYDPDGYWVEIIKRI
jgi:lactoylglutathione lyase